LGNAEGLVLGDGVLLMVSLNAPPAAYEAAHLFIEFSQTQTELNPRYASDGVLLAAAPLWYQSLLPQADAALLGVIAGTQTPQQASTLLNP
jgi:hypothetical protein